MKPYTYGGPEVFLILVAFVVTPLVYRFALRRRPIRVRVTGLALLWMCALLAAYWEPYMISRELRELCRTKAGLHVYRTVEAEGFLGSTNIEYWVKQGFRFVEHRSGHADVIWRFQLRGNEIVKEEVGSLLSTVEYSVIYTALDDPFVRQSAAVRDIATKEVLGEILYFAAYPGHLDRWILGLTGFTWSPMGCDGDREPESRAGRLTYRDLVRSVIRPTT